MQKLNIEITKAQLVGFHVTFNEDGIPQVSADISLLTEGAKEITQTHLSTDSYMKDKRFELPVGMHMPIQRIAGLLEGVIIEHLRDEQLKLKENV